MQLNLFETPQEKSVRELPEELRDIVERLQIAWGNELLGRGAWINQLGAFGSTQPEDAFEGLLAAGVLEDERGLFRMGGE